MSEQFCVAMYVVHVVVHVWRVSYGVDGYNFIATEDGRYDAEGVECMSSMQSV